MILMGERLVPQEAVDAALHAIWREVRHHGPSAEEIAAWQESTAVPWLRDDPRIQGLLPESIRQYYSMWAEPQILLRWPDDPDPTWTIQPHVDEVPTWAAEGGLEYGPIVQVALTTAGVRDGCLHVWDDFGTLGFIPVVAGDVVVMDAWTEHSGWLNLGPTVRAAVYFRALVPQRRTSTTFEV